MCVCITKNNTQLCIKMSQFQNDCNILDLASEDEYSVSKLKSSYSSYSINQSNRLVSAEVIDLVTSSDNEPNDTSHKPSPVNFGSMNGSSFKEQWTTDEAVPHLKFEASGQSPEEQPLISLDSSSFKLTPVKRIREDILDMKNDENNTDMIEKNTDKSVVDISKTQKKKKLSKEEAHERKRLENLKKAEEKRSLKEKRQEEKRLERELKQKKKLEEQALRKANTASIDKSKNVTKMTLELDDRIDDVQFNCIKCFMEENGAKVVRKHSAYPRTVLWKRRANREWSRDEKQFVPCEEFISEDPVVVHIIDGSSFAELVRQKRLELFFMNLKNIFSEKLVIVLLYGLNEYERKVRNEMMKAFEKNLPINERIPSLSELKKTIIDLSLSLDIKVTQLMKNDNIEEWILSLTREISSGPDILAKRFRTNAGVSVSLDEKVSSGKTQSETWWKMLQILFGMTPSMAQAVVCAFPTMQLLRKFCLEIPSEEEAKIQLSVLNISAPNSSSQNARARRLGPQMAARIWLNMRCQNPSKNFR